MATKIEDTIIQNMLTNLEQNSSASIHVRTEKHNHTNTVTIHEMQSAVTTSSGCTDVILIFLLIQVGLMMANALNITTIVFMKIRNSRFSK